MVEKEPTLFAVLNQLVTSLIECWRKGCVNFMPTEEVRERRLPTRILVCMKTISLVTRFRPKLPLHAIYSLFGKMFLFFITLLLESCITSHAYVILLPVSKARRQCAQLKRAANHCKESRVAGIPSANRSVCKKLVGI